MFLIFILLKTVLVQYIEKRAWVVFWINEKNLNVFLYRVGLRSFPVFKKKVTLSFIIVIICNQT